jgi:GNAT superfamily N-acetyltransferase
MDIRYNINIDLEREKGLHLYHSVECSAAKKPDRLLKALSNSDTVVTAWDEGLLIGLGNAITDGHLVVYYPHLVVLPTYQRRGVGSQIVKILFKKYASMHQHSIIADGNAVGFYEKCGFKKPNKCVALWIYDGNDHG